MHVAVDLNWFLQFIGFAFAAVFGLLYLVRNTASRYFVVDSSFDSSAADYSLDQKKRLNMGAPECIDSCAVCGLRTKKHCAGCKMVKYCSGVCQKSHWDSEHKAKCVELRTFYKANHESSASVSRRKASVVPLGGSTRFIEPSNKILFPYKDFVKLFNWDKAGYPPCGLLNCGNSCFANVVLQCLAYTRPLLAYLLEKGHRIECHSEDWCFFCEFQTHVERAIQCVRPFSPINILSRLPKIGGNLGYGKQEDAHEFMRFAIDNMQSVCLDKFGGERAVHPIYQETTLIQHIFGGRLQSQVVCKECNNVSSQFENMMDLTVEIHGDAESLEECLDQFTAEEQLQGDNMYKCDGCNAYVMASKRLLIQRAPNILTIALKRFQSGRFGKLNKKVTFPETLDLRAYMSELEDGNDVYKLYAVIVHVDMLNASFFGHYICYVKDFRGNWYRIDDCKVESVDLDEVLSQGAYMLLYSRIRVRPSSLLPDESLSKEENKKMKIEEIDTPEKQPAECSSASGCIDSPLDPEQPSDSELKINSEEELYSNPDEKDGKWVFSEPNQLLVKDVELHMGEELSTVPEVAFSVSTSLIDITTKQPDVAVGDVNRESKTDASEGLFTKLVEDSHSAENCTLKEGKNMCDVSASVITDSTSVPENSMSGNSLSYSGDMQDRAKKSDLGSSAAKLKPVFAPGFLGKRPQKKVSKPQNFSELTPNGCLDNQTNDIGRGGISEHNLHVAKDVEFLNSEELFKAPEVVSPVNHVSRPDPIPTDTFLTNRIAKQPGLENVEFSLPDVVEDASRGSVSNADEGFRKLPEVSDADESCTFEEGRSTCDNDGSATVFTTGEFRDEMNPGSSTSRLKNAIPGKGSPSSHDIHDAAKRSDPKTLKPIFTPGFLGKRTRTKVIKPGDEVPANFIELAPNSHLHNKKINEVEKPRENGAFLKDMEKPYLVHANGKAHSNSYICPEC